MKEPEGWDSGTRNLSRGADGSPRIAVEVETAMMLSFVHVNARTYNHKKLHDVLMGVGDVSCECRETEVWDNWNRHIFNPETRCPFVPYM